MEKKYLISTGSEEILRKQVEELTNDNEKLREERVSLQKFIDNLKRALVTSIAGMRKIQQTLYIPPDLKIPALIVLQL